MKTRIGRAVELVALGHTRTFRANPFTCALIMQHSDTGPTATGLSWRDYRKILFREWRALLKVNAPEPDFQQFFERHPCMLPLPEGHHGPLFSGVVSQPVLPGIDRPRPDFMWLSRNSMTNFAVLVEIETPGKRWFTKAGQPTSELTQARDQLVQWRSWFDDPAHQELFWRLYGRADSYFPWRSLRPITVLIYGRRSEATAVPVFARKRRHMQGPDELLMSFDRLRPDRDLANYCTLKSSDGELRITHVSPTLHWNHFDVREWLAIPGLESALESNQYIDPARKQYLLSRLPYWKKRANSRGPHRLSERD